MRNNLDPIPHDLFGYDARTKEFTTELSDLEASSHGPFSQIYDDACDQGFYLKGKKHQVLFVLSHAVKDNEGDIICWEFRSTHVGALYIGDYSCTIFND